MSSIFFSMIMPVLNSERTIEKALCSIREQDFPQDRIEILVIDGGSKDRTLEIAEKYNVRILENKQVIPETAKQIGIQKARGEWIVFFDSDEVLTDKRQLGRRYYFLKSNPDVYCYKVNRLIPGENSGFCCPYLNIVSDPFSYVVYKNKGSFIKTNKKHLKYKNAGYVYEYQDKDVIPVGDGGNTSVSLKKARELFGEEVNTQEFAVSAFSQVASATHYIGCIPGDNVRHYSAAKMTNYLKKLRFRVNINLNQAEKSGYSAREKYNAPLSKRKWVFLAYCLTGIGPVFDSLKLACFYHRPSFLLHFFYTYYVFFAAAAEMAGKIFKCGGRKYTYG